MRCPKCETQFMAMPPPASTEAPDPFGALMKSVPATSHTPVAAKAPPPAEMNPGAGSAIPLSLDDLEVAPLELARSPTRATTTSRVPVAVAEPTAPSARPPPKQKKDIGIAPGPSRAVRGLSWVALMCGGAIAVTGLAIAGWSSETLALDDTWMATIEEVFAITPPVSFLTSTANTLEANAVAAEQRGDAAAALSWWRQLQRVQPDHATATQQATVWARQLGEKP
jgi:hypothetical protein